MNLNDHDRVDRHFLMERHLISYEHANGDGIKGILIGDRELISIMINEEDHLRLQGMQSGLQLKEVWDVVEKIDRDLEKRLNFAFSDEIGYLTACPTNTGTGLRASILVHLPALVLRNEVDKFLQILGKLGIVTRGLYGEGTKIMGDMFQISNQVTLGPVEETIISKLESVGRRIVDNEVKSREILHKENKKGFDLFILHLG
ncbi:Protein-arginine kinase [subsurface metagenome]